MSHGTKSVHFAEHIIFHIIPKWPTGITKKYLLGQTIAPHVHFRYDVQRFPYKRCWVKGANAASDSYLLSTTPDRLVTEIRARSSNDSKTNMQTNESSVKTERQNVEHFDNQPFWLQQNSLGEEGLFRLLQPIIVNFKKWSLVTSLGSNRKAAGLCSFLCFPFASDYKIRHNEGTMCSTMPTWGALSHLIILITNSEGVLVKQLLKRRIHLGPHFFAVASVVAQTNLWLSSSSRETQLYLQERFGG